MKSISSSLEAQFAQDSIKQAKIRRKVDSHLLPVLFWLALVTSLDGFSVGNARLSGLEKDLKMTGREYNTAVLVYFIPTILSEVPGNLLMQIYRPPIILTVSALACGMIIQCEVILTGYFELIT